MTAAFAAAAAMLVLAAWALSRRIEARHPAAGLLIDVGPGAVHCVETPPSAPARGAALLIHGASGNSGDLHVALADRLSDLGFRVISVDRPGHGWSGRLAARREATSPERQAEWIRAALERLGVAEAIVVVHSLAGAVGLAMALNAPNFVRGLVLLAPASHPYHGGYSWYYNVAAARWVGPAFNWLVAPWAGLVYLNAGMRSVFAPNPTPLRYAERTGLRLLLRPWVFRANAEDVVDFERHVRRLQPRYASIRAPTAIVTGDRDSVVWTELHSGGCARDIPGATLRVLPGVGHSPHYADPEAVIEAILEVDRRVTAPAEPREASKANA